MKYVFLLLYLMTSPVQAMMVAFLGASFDRSASWSYSDGPRVETFLQGMFAFGRDVLYPINLPGGSSKDHLNHAEWLLAEIDRINQGQPNYLVLGLTGSVFDPQNTIIQDYTEIIQRFQKRGITVFVTRFPPYEGGNSYVEANLDPTYYADWNGRFELEMRKLGAIILSVYPTWQSNDLPIPLTGPHGDYHLDIRSSIDAATRYFLLLRTYNICIDMPDRDYCQKMFYQATTGVLGE